MTRIMSQERGSHPLCCLVWSLGSCCEEGLLAVRILCLNHDATWRIPLEHVHATPHTGLGLDSRCPAVREVDPRTHPQGDPAPQAASAPSAVDTLSSSQLSLLSLTES